MNLTEILLMVSGYVLAGAVLLWLVAEKTRHFKNISQLKEKQENLEKQQALSEQARQAAEQSLSRKEEEIVSLRQKISEIEKLEVQRSTELKATREALNSERDLLNQAKEKLQDTFKSLAASTLEGSTRQFLHLAKEQLGKDTELAKVDLEKRQQAIDSLLKPFKETLDRYHEKTNELERERQKSYSSVESELKKMAEAGVVLAKETSALKDALKRPHIRGRWGEVQLKNCVELAGMSEFCDVSFQDVQGSDHEHGRLIPDMTVRMPGGRLVVVDCKTPVDAFMSALEAQGEEKRMTEMVRHGKHVKLHVQQLSEKGYAQRIKDSADFTVMFLPNESFLYAALETQPDLVDYALAKKVLIATPPTLVGLLKVIRFGWNEKKLAKNAMEISIVGQELHKRMAEFLQAYEEVGLKLTQAQQAFETGRMRFSSRIFSQAKRLEELGAKSIKELPEVSIS